MAFITVKRPTSDDTFALTDQGGTLRAILKSVLGAGVELDSDAAWTLAVDGKGLLKVEGVDDISVVETAGDICTLAATGKRAFQWQDGDRTFAAKFSPNEIFKLMADPQATGSVLSSKVEAGLGTQIDFTVKTVSSLAEALLAVMR